jgi:hypothetical protein
MRVFPSLDILFRIIVILLAGFVLVQYSTLFEEEYGKKFIQLYIQPWWRLLLVLLIIASAAWCPSVGIVVALIGFFYLSDMNTLITPLPNL